VKKALIVTTNFPRWAGDPHSPWLVELLRLLRGQGWTIEVLAPTYAGQGSHVIDGMVVHRFRYAPARWETLTHNEGAPNKIRRRPQYLLLLPLYLAAGMLAAWRLGRATEFDVIHVHWPVPQGLLGWAARWGGGGRLVATFYGADLVMSQRFPFVRPFLRAFVHSCADVVAISSYTAQQLAEATGVRARLLPYGIALPPADANWPATPGLILAVGRLIARKGHRYLIEAMSTVAVSHPTARLVIVGDGHERPQLEALIRERSLVDCVTLAGRVSDAALQQYYQNCQMFVLPSIVDNTGDTEMLGMVSLEAMAYRKPVVATHVGGVADIVQDGVTGLLVQQRDPVALATAMSRLLDDPAWAARMGQAGYAFARDHFAWPAVVAQALTLYGAGSSDTC
jgi:glycosyltransferase involved in cell wall biosynthesis